MLWLFLACKMSGDKIKGNAMQRRPRFSCFYHQGITQYSVTIEGCKLKWLNAGKMTQTAALSK